MKTKNIFKALAFAMLIISACNTNEIANDENMAEKGYTLPVTINVTREGDDATKATFNDGTKKLEFSTGDKLYVEGSETTADSFSGTLTLTSGGTFSGTLTTTNEYTGTAEELLTAASFATATLLPDGYESIGFHYFDPYLSTNYTKAFALTKAAAVEQFSWECATSYSSGFALAPRSAILNFTITGLAASTFWTQLFDS